MNHLYKYAQYTLNKLTWALFYFLRQGLGCICYCFFFYTLLKVL